MNRRRILASWAKSGYTANDYVQDGCFLMLDAIENAGFGVHDSTMTSWKNLATNPLVGDVSLQGNIQIYDKYVRTNKDAINSSPDTGIGYSTCNIPSGVRTYEVVFSDATPNYVSSSNRKGGVFFWPSNVPILYLSAFSWQSMGVPHMPALWSPSYDDGIVGAAESHQDRTEIYKVITLNGLSSFGAILGASSVRKEFGFINGILPLSIQNPPSSYGAANGYSGTIEFFNRSSDFSRPLNAKVHAIRMYNRALSSEEVSANYEIDKARFNLT